MSDVLEDLRRIESFASELGLELNCSKSEVISGDQSTLDMHFEVHGFTVVNLDKAELLG